MHQRAGDRDTLQLAARKLPGIAGPSVAQPYRIEHLAGALESRRARLFLKDERERDVPRQIEMRQNVEGLEHEADRVAAKCGSLSLAQPRQIGSGHHDFPRVRSVEPRDDVEQGRLSGADSPRIATRSPASSARVSPEKSRR